MTTKLYFFPEYKVLKLIKIHFRASFYSIKKICNNLKVFVNSKDAASFSSYRPKLVKGDCRKSANLCFIMKLQADVLVIVNANLFFYKANDANLFVKIFTLHLIIFKQQPKKIKYLRNIALIFNFSNYRNMHYKINYYHKKNCS